MTLRVSVRPGPPPEPGPPRPRGRDSLRGLACGLVASPAAFFLVTCPWYLSGHFGWRYLTDSPVLGAVFGVVAGLPIGYFRLRPAAAALLGGCLAGAFEVTLWLVFVSIGAEHPSSLSDFARAAIEFLYLASCGAAAGSVAAAVLRSWSKRAES